MHFLPFRRAMLLLGCAVSAAQATTLLRWDTLELARRSDAVVQARVLQVSCRWSSDGMKILTDVDLEVQAVWKGQVGTRIRVVQPGGEIEGLAQRVDGVAAFAKGEEVVVFLEAPTAERYALTGMAQGKYRVDREHGVLAVPEALSGVELLDPKSRRVVKPAASALPLAQLRAQVEATVPGPQ